MFLSGVLQGFDKRLFAQRIQRTGKIPIAFMQKIVCSELTDRILVACDCRIELQPNGLIGQHRSADRLASVRPDRIEKFRLIAQKTVEILRIKLFYHAWMIDRKPQIEFATSGVNSFEHFRIDVMRLKQNMFFRIFVGL